MKDNSPQLQIIGQLALEYDEKYRKLEKLISETQPEKVALKLSALAEQTVDRFRSAEIDILSRPDLFEGEKMQNVKESLMTLCRTFDEMRLLFLFLFGNCSYGE